MLIIHGGVDLGPKMYCESFLITISLEATPAIEGGSEILELEEFEIGALIRPAHTWKFSSSIISITITVLA